MAGWDWRRGIPRSLPLQLGPVAVAHRRLAVAPLRIARQIVEHLEPWELFVGMRVQRRRQARRIGQRPGEQVHEVGVRSDR